MMVRVLLTLFSAACAMSLAVFALVCAQVGHPVLAVVNCGLAILNFALALKHAQGLARP